MREERIPRMLTELVCRVCHEQYAAYRPTADERDEPICPTCRVTTIEGVKQLFGISEPKRGDREAN